MAFQIIASSSSSPTFSKSNLFSSPPLQLSHKALNPNLLGFSQFSPYIGLKHLGISISPKSSNPEKKMRCKGLRIRASLFGVGAPEALVIGVVALLVFGPKGLAEVARNLGKTLRAFQPTIRELQDVSRDFKSTLEREIGLDDICSSNDYNPNRIKPVQSPPPPQPSDASNEVSVTKNDPDDIQSPKPYTTEDYLKITEAQLKASSLRETQTDDRTQIQESIQPTKIQIPTGENQSNGTARETADEAPPRQD